jgi:dephospho-CoA kinase
MTEYGGVTLVVFGLTGGLASGKSTVASRFRARGVPVIDADQLARDVVLPGTPALRELAAHFGGDLIRSDGTLDRKALGARAFAQPSELRTLEAITHPRIAEAAKQRARELEQAGHPLACYEAALLVERGLAPRYRPLVVVSAPPDLQVARACARDGLSEHEARARLAAQWPLAAKVALADHVIVNDGGLERITEQADSILDAIASALDIDPAHYPRPHASTS